MKNYNCLGKNYTNFPFSEKQALCNTGSCHRNVIDQKNIFLQIQDIKIHEIFISSIFPFLTAFVALNVGANMQIKVKSFISINSASVQINVNTTRPSLTPCYLHGITLLKSQILLFHLYPNVSDYHIKKS
jgi:hypothetical protein